MTYGLSSKDYCSFCFHKEQVTTELNDRYISKTSDKVHCKNNKPDTRIPLVLLPRLWFEPYSTMQRVINFIYVCMYVCMYVTGERQRLTQ